MRVLVVDTALGLCTVGLFEAATGDDLRCLGLRSEPMSKGHSERVAGFARDAVAETGFSAIDRIGVTVGPGSFTGLRVGLAFAQGLGAALDRPVVGISGLAALAASAGPGPVAAVIDARRGQVYARFVENGVATGPDEALSLDLAAARIGGMPAGARLIGSGAALFAEAFRDLIAMPLAGPTPEALARLVAAADPATAPPRPLYLRAPDAVPPTRLPGQARPARAS